MTNLKCLLAFIITASAACINGVDAEEGEHTDAGADGSPDESTVASTSCRDASDCNDGEFCALQPCDASSCSSESCGGEGTCASLADPCEPTDPVCGCDGELHASRCDAQRAGVHVTGRWLCAPPEGKFRCGERLCLLDTQYCQMVGDYEGGGTDTCVPIPESCIDGATADCQCLFDNTGPDASCSVCNNTTPDEGIFVECILNP